MFAVMGAWGEAFSRIGLFLLRLQTLPQVGLHLQTWLCLQLLHLWILYHILPLNHLLQLM